MPPEPGPRPGDSILRTARRNAMNADRTSCPEVLEKLPLSVGGDLDPEALESVRAHLALCASCARRAAEVDRARASLIGALRAREADARNPELWPGIREVLSREGLIPGRSVLPAGERGQGARSRPGASPKRGARWMQRALVPLAAAAAVVALVQLGSRTGEPPERGPGRVRPAPGLEAPLLTIEQWDATPVLDVTPVGGRLQRVTGEDAEPKKFVRPRAGRPGVEPGGASLAGYGGYK